MSFLSSRPVLMTRPKPVPVVAQLNASRLEAEGELSRGSSRTNFIDVCDFFIIAIHRTSWSRG
jgi:hypothetical protein